MLDVVIFGICRYDPFFGRTNLLFLLLGCGDCIALVDPPADLFKSNRAVQENGDPVSPADVIAAKKPWLLYEHICKHGIAHFHVDDIDPVCILQTQLVPGRIHDDRKPLAVVFMAKDRVFRCSGKGIIRLYPVFLFYISTYIII